MAELFDILTYDTAEVGSTDITTTEPDWTDLISLLTPDRVAGVYELRFALQFILNSTAQSFLYQFSLDGGGSWGPIYEKEVKDRSNTEVIEVLAILNHAGGPIDLRCRVTRDGTADCTVMKAFIVCERKK